MVGKFGVSFSIILIGLLIPAGIIWPAVEEQNIAFDQQTNVIQNMGFDQETDAINVLSFGPPVLPTGAGPADVNPVTDLIEPALDPRGDVSISPAVSVTPVAGPAFLLGDFNRDHRVDAADYVVWRKQDGSQSGYDEWRNNIGRSQ